MVFYLSPYVLHQAQPRDVFFPFVIIYRKHMSGNTFWNLRTIQLLWVCYTIMSAGHGSVINNIISWCDDSFLGFTHWKQRIWSLILQRSKWWFYQKKKAVESVESQKHLGIFIHSQLTVNKNCEAVCKKGLQRLFYSRKTSQHWYNHVDSPLLRFYRVKMSFFPCFLFW